MFRREELDYRTKEARLFEELQWRYRWDLVKVITVLIYLGVRVAFHLNASSVEGIPLVGGFLASFPSLDAIGATVLTIITQYRNIKHYLIAILPKAENVAYRHGKRRAA